MKLRRFRKAASHNTPGEESFLDVVANLVGVLIILVVVVGANAGSRIRHSAVAGDQANLAKLEADVEKARQAARAMLADHRELEQKMGLEGLLVTQRQMERQQMLVVLEAARREIRDRESEMSHEQQLATQQLARRDELRHQLAEVRTGLRTLSADSEQRQIIEHYPTPIAKTVFSDEMHFRIREGRIVHVPMDELVSEMRNEWQEKARKLETADTTVETVGPAGDFRLQYQLDVDEEPLMTGFGPVPRRTPRFTRFVLVPIGDSIGVPLGEALADNSDFSRRIAGLNPQKTTISVWVYPDSFSEFNQLKSWLWKRGFRTACWPLSANSPISGGPSGYRSTAQ
jgi:hypothetical protein